MGHELPTLRELVFSEFRGRLSASMEMLCGESVTVDSAADEPGSTLIWRLYRIQPGADFLIAVGAPELIRQAIGAKVLHAAGLDELTQEDVIGSYHEVLQGAVSAVVQTLGRVVGKDLAEDQSMDRSDEPELALRVPLALRLREQVIGPLVFGISEALLELGNPDASSRNVSALQQDCAYAPRKNAYTGESTPQGHSLERILALDLPLRVSFGKANLPLQDVLKLTTGSIVELNRSILDPVEIIVNDRVVGRGEVVVIEGNYGIRIQEMVGFDAESNC